MQNTKIRGLDFIIPITLIFAYFVASVFLGGFNLLSVTLADGAKSGASMLYTFADTGEIFKVFNAIYVDVHGNAPGEYTWYGFMVYFAAAGFGFAFAALSMLRKNRAKKLRLVVLFLSLMLVSVLFISAIALICGGSFGEAKIGVNAIIFVTDVVLLVGGILMSRMLLRSLKPKRLSEELNG